jgi:hypothetical protein
LEDCPLLLPEPLPVLSRVKVSGIGWLKLST